MANDLILNRFFTRNTFRSLIIGNTNKLYNATIQHCNIICDGKNNLSIIQEIYSYLSHCYRNEYYYKNTLLNTLLLGRHKPTTTTALTEIPVGTAKADFVLINGKAVVYEIKTELDNLDRLEHQINEYYKAFRYVVVVTYPENFETVKRFLTNPYVGIYVITQKGTISKKQVREPMEYVELLDKSTIFPIMRKNEFEQSIKRAGYELPSTTAFKYYRTCNQLFDEIYTNIQAQRQLEIALKSRIKVNAAMFKTIPYELRFIAYFSNMSQEDYTSATTFLETNSKEENVCTFLY